MAGIRGSLAVVGLVVLAAVPWAVASPQSVVAASSTPCVAGASGIAAGGDGRMWFTEYPDKEIGAITTSGTLTEYPAPVDSFPPQRIAPAPSGTDMYFSQSSADQVGRISVSGQVTEYALHFPQGSGFPDGVAPGPDGREWVADLNRGLAAIDSAGTIAYFPVSGGATSLTTGGDGNIWFTQGFGGSIGRMTPGGSLTLFNVGAEADGITLGPDGNIWFGLAGQVGRITPSGSATIFPLPGISASAPTELTTGSDAAVWLTGGTDIVRVAMDGTTTNYPVPETSPQIHGIAAGPDGRIWFTSDSFVGQSTTAGGITLIPLSSPVPVMCGVSPNYGPAAGGNTITIRGRGFGAATAVSFGATPAQSFSIVDDAMISAVAPAGTSGDTVDVTVTGPGGTSAAVSGDRYFYYHAPVVTGLSPASGSTAGGNTVTISGQYLTSPGNPNGLTISFGDAPVTRWFSDATQGTISAIVPQHVAATVDVVVSGAQTSAPTPADQYTYVAPVPVVTGVQPGGGLPAGGNTVTISGHGLVGVTAVTFGGVPATGVVWQNDGLAYATAPAHATGVVDVTVMTAGGTSATNAADRYIYAPPPVVQSLSPTSGSSLGGTQLTITGQYLTGAMLVQFGAGTDNFALATVVSDTQVTAYTPSLAAGTTVDVIVITNSGASPTSAGDRYTYVPPSGLLTCSASGTLSNDGSTWSTSGSGTCTDQQGQSQTVSFNGTAPVQNDGVCGSTVLPRLDLQISERVIGSSGQESRPEVDFDAVIATYPLSTPVRVTDIRGVSIGAGAIVSRLFAMCPSSGSDAATFTWAQQF